MGQTSCSQASPIDQTWFRIEVSCKAVQLPPEPRADRAIRSFLASASKSVIGSDLFNEVRPKLKARFTRRGGTGTCDAGPDLADRSAKQTVYVGDDVEFEPYFISLNNIEQKGLLKFGDEFELHLTLLHDPKYFRSQDIAIGTCVCSGSIAPDEVLELSAPLEEDSTCTFKVKCRVESAVDAAKVLGNSSKFALIEIISKITSVLGGPNGIELLLESRPKELRSRDALAREELVKLNSELRDKMSESKGRRSKLEALSEEEGWSTPVQYTENYMDSLRVILGRDSHLQPDEALKTRTGERMTIQEFRARFEGDDLRNAFPISIKLASRASGESSTEGSGCEETEVIQSLNIFSRGLLNFSDRFKNDPESDVSDLVVQWMRNFFRRCSGADTLSFNEDRLRRLLAAAQVQLQSLEPIDENECVLSWANKINSKANQKEQAKAWFENVCCMRGNRNLMPARLGSGAYGSVWRGKDKHTGHVYAIKNVHSDDKYHRHLAQRETDLLMLICMDRHPCIVGFFYAGFVDIDGSNSMHVHVLEFCSGGDLKSKIMKGRQMGDDHGWTLHDYSVPALALTWIGQLMLALEYLHLHMQVLHRDIKPQNVVFHKDVAKLTDFGFSNKIQHIDPCGFHTFGCTPGSPFYVAPEVWCQKQYDFKADMYSMGPLMWVLLTGGIKDDANPPYDSNGRWHKNRLQLKRCMDLAPAVVVKEIHVTEGIHSSCSEACESGRIGQIKFVYSDGRIKTWGIKGSSNSTESCSISSHEAFLLLDDEYLKGLYYKRCPEGNLCKVQFETNKCRLSPAYGNDGDDRRLSSSFADRETQIFALAWSGEGSPGIEQEWVERPQGRGPLPSVAAADLISQLIKEHPSARPDHKSMRQHQFMRDIDLPPIGSNIEQVTEWSTQSTRAVIDAHQ